MRKGPIRKAVHIGGAWKIPNMTILFSLIMGNVWKVAAKPCSFAESQSESSTPDMNLTSGGTRGNYPGNKHHRGVQR